MTKTDYEKLKLQRRKAQINGKIEALIIERENINRILSIIEAEKYTPRQFIANEVSQFFAGRRL